MKWRKVLLIGFASVLLLTIVGGLAFLHIARSGSGTIEQWIGAQFQSIANSYLNPKLTFTDLDYKYPGTVSLKNFRLTADDPAQPGKKIDILAASEAAVTLAEIPRRGQPIVIEKISLNHPLISAVAVAPDSSQFVGFSNLMRGGAGQSTSAPASQPVAQGPTSSQKLSDAFHIRLIELKDGRIVYDPRISGSEPMMLDQINTSLNIQMAEPGHYNLDTRIIRAPVFDFHITGQLDLDRFNGRDIQITIRADLGADKLDYLPPQLQQLIRKYEARGVLDVRLTGDLPLMDPMGGSLELTVKLSQANVATGDYRVPVDQLEMLARLQDRKALLPKLTIAALGGNADITGSARLNDRLDAAITVHVTGMLLEKLLSAKKDAQPSHIAGKLDLLFEAAAPMMVVLAKTAPGAGEPGATTAPALASEQLAENWGSASLQLVNARLAEIKLIRDLNNALASAGKVARMGNAESLKEPRDKASVALNLSRDQVVFNDINYSGDVMAARGKGTMTLDQKLDLTLNAGPVEKVEALLGKHVGGAIGSVTDSLVVYRVTGNADNPQVNVVVVGGAVGNTFDKIGDGFGKIGRGIGDIFTPKKDDSGK
jgi:hypothetical protein